MILRQSSIFSMYKVFYHPFIISLGMFSVSFTQLSFNHSAYLQNITNSTPGSTQANRISRQTILLANTLFTVGSYIGNFTLIQYLDQLSPRKYFFIADILVIIAQLSSFLLILENVIWADIYFFLRIVTGLSNGINVSLCSVFIRQTQTKKTFKRVGLLVPLMLQFGFLVSLMEDYYDVDSTTQGQSQDFIMWQLVPIIPSLIRSGFLIFYYTEESPIYYYFVEKDKIKAINMLTKIQTFDQQEQPPVAVSQDLPQCDTSKSEIFDRSYASFEISLSQLTQTSLYKLSSIPTIFNGFLPEDLYSQPYLRNFVRCSLLVILAQFSGYYVITYDSELLIKDVNKFLVVGSSVGFVVILCLIISTRQVKPKYYLIAGQLLLALGLMILMFGEKITIGYSVAVIYFFGYSLGLGTFFYIILPLLLPDVGVFQCTLAQWFFILICQCIVGIYENKQITHRNQQIGILNNVTYYFFGFTVLGVGLIYYAFKHQNEQYKNKNQKEESLKNNNEVQQLHLEESIIIQTLQTQNQQTIE